MVETLYTDPLMIPNVQMIEAITRLVVGVGGWEKEEIWLTGL
jgi:hypothetical protein